jgi:hypothetical protein
MRLEGQVEKLEGVYNQKKHALLLVLRLPHTALYSQYGLSRSLVNPDW